MLSSWHFVLTKSAGSQEVHGSVGIVEAPELGSSASARNPLVLEHRLAGSQETAHVISEIEGPGAAGAMTQTSLGIVTIFTSL